MNPRWLWPILLLCCVAAGKKQPAVTVRFHTETTAQGETPFAIPAILQYPPRRVFLSRVPEISERNITAVYPFPAADGTLGCAFKLDGNGRFALETLSTDKRGSSLVAYLNGRQVIDMQIDKPVRDGVVTISRGLAPQEIELLQKKFPTLGQGKKRKR